MLWLGVLAAALVVCFGFVLLFGAPYLPTLSRQVEAALDMADLAPGETLLELGCGDGKVLLAAARRGLNAVGYELNPLLAAVAWLRTRRCHSRVHVVCGNFWQAPWPPAEAVFVFLLDKYMPRLDTKIAQYSGRQGKPVRLVSFAFQVPGKQPAQSHDGVYRYDYAAVRENRSSSDPLQADAALLHDAGDSSNISSMNNVGKPDSRGGINVLFVPFVLLLMIFVMTATFALWAYNSREDYRKNTDQKIAAAVTAAKQQEDAVKDKEYQQASKQPLTSYTGPEQFGSLHVWYPRTWSGYVDDITTGGQAVNGYFQPGVVPSVNFQDARYALRVQVQNQSYATIVQGMNSNLKGGKLTAQPYSFPRVPSAVGIRYDGSIQQNDAVTGVMIVMPMRDKTLEVWTESPSYSADFTNFVLPNLTFSP